MLFIASHNNLGPFYIRVLVHDMNPGKDLLNHIWHGYMRSEFFNLFQIHIKVREYVRVQACIGIYEVL